MGVVEVSRQCTAPSSPNRSVQMNLVPFWLQTLLDQTISSKVKSHGLLFPMSLISNKNTVSLFYRQAGPIDKACSCQCGISCTQNGKYFSNLMQHLKRRHPAELKTARSKPTPEQRSCLGKLSYCLKVISNHGWLIYLICCLCRFVVVQDEHAQTHISYEEVSLTSS